MPRLPALLLFLVAAPVLAAAETVWFAPEVTGATADEREFVTRLFDNHVGMPFEHDDYAFTHWCETIKGQFPGRNPQCSLFFANGKAVRRAHYNVEFLGDAREAAEPARRNLSLPADLVRLKDRFLTVWQAAAENNEAVQESVRDGFPVYAHQRLAQVSAELRRKVPGRTKLLMEALLHAADPQVRADAALLLWWSGKPESVVQTARAAFDDPDIGVRANLSRLAARNVASFQPAEAAALTGIWCARLASPRYLDQNRALTGLANVAPEVRAGLPADCRQRVADLREKTAVEAMREAADRVLSARK